MKNTVLVERKLRQRLRLACTLLCVFCLLFIAFVVFVTMIDRYNLNGQTLEITGVLNTVYESDANTITIDKDKHYNVIWDDEELNVNMTEFKGKTVTLIVAKETFASNPWAFGLIVDGQTVVDYNATLEKQKAYNSEEKTILIAITAVLCAATCGVFIWRFNVKPTEERELYKEFGEFLRDRQPTCPQRKFLIAYVCAYGIILLALIIIGLATAADADTWSEMTTASKAITITSVSFAVLGIGGMIALNEWIARKEIDFYAEKLPFDFADISHAPLRKKLRVQLQEALKKEYEEHPDTYADGGNGYDVTFDDKGVTLTTPFDDEHPHYSEQIEMPDAEEIFSNLSKDKSTAVYDNEQVRLSKNGLRFSYEELNFEAIAYYRKNSRPMMIIIKSRLTYSDGFPEELVNDIHIPFDINLSNTLSKYNVAVENLQYLMNNKKRLMSENCLVLSKNKSKTQK